MLLKNHYITHTCSPISTFYLCYPSYHFHDLASVKSVVALSADGSLSLSQTEIVTQLESTSVLVMNFIIKYKFDCNYKQKTDEKSKYFRQ